MTPRNYFRLLAEDRPYVNRWSWFWNPVLSVASLFYLAGLSIHQYLYRAGILKRHTFSHPVISVGNLTWGGTGKTPLVEYIARFYLNRANIPLILSRGYGEDESKLLARQLPQAQFGIGKDRYRVGEQVLGTHPADVIILDDGFQHWRIKRSLDVVIVNILNPFGNRMLIPRGILREPCDALKRASLVVLSDINLASRKEVEDLKTKIRSIAPKIEFVEASREALYLYRPGSRERISVDRLQGKRVTSFSGIGTPRSFQMLLNHLGLKAVRNFEFSDHHRFTTQELNEIVHAKEASESEEIITTEKDFFRCEEPIKRIVRPLILKVRFRLTVGESLLHHHLNPFAQPPRPELQISRQGQQARYHHHPAKPQHSIPVPHEPKEMLSSDGTDER